MTGRVAPRTAARIAALAFVMLTIVASTILIEHHDKAPTVATRSESIAHEDGPTRDRLTHCQELGEAAAHNAECLRTWAVSRRRFLTPSARPTERPPVDLFPSVLESPRGAPGNPTIDPPREE